MHPSRFRAEHAPLVPPEGDTRNAGRRFCAGLASQPARERKFALSADIHDSSCPANRRASLGDAEDIRWARPPFTRANSLFGALSIGLM